ncbi:hypothetical protein CFP59_07149 [Streptomyces malaysiensis subsp. malaysiensis]|nr:hypothetical protein CFP59_07149 [Streptomyces sp. M56]
MTICQVIGTDSCEPECALRRRIDAGTLPCPLRPEQAIGPGRMLPAGA